MPPITVADAAIAIGGDLSGYDKSLKQAEGMTQSAGQRIRDYLTPDRVTKALTGLGATAGAVAVSAVEKFTTFEDKLRTIQTVATDLTEDQLKGIGDELQQLSRDTGKTTDDLADGFYDLVSAGVSAEDAIGILRDSAHLAVGALGSTKEAVNLVVSSMNAYGLAASSSTRVTDIWAKAVADGQTTAAQLGQSISTIAPIASAAGISMEEIAASTALMTAKGAPAAEAFTNMRQAISALLTPNETLLRLQEQTGVKFADVAREKGLAVALEELRVATGGNTEEFAKALGSVQALQYGLATTGENAGAMATELDKVTVGADQGGVALEQFGIKSSSAAEQGKRMAATWETFLQDIGESGAAFGPFLFALNQISPAFLKGGIASRLFGATIGALIGKSIVPAIAKLKALAAAGRLGGFLQDLSLGRGLLASIKGAFAAAVAQAGISGTLAGTAFTVAAAAAIIAAPIAVMLVAIKIAGDIEKQTKDLAVQLGEFTEVATTEELVKARQGVAERLAAMGNDPIADALGLSARKGIEQTLAGLDAEIVARMNELDSPALHQAAADVGAAIEDPIVAAAGHASRAVRQTSYSILTTIQTLRAGLTGDAAAAAAALYDPIIAALELAETQEEYRAVKKKLRDEKITADERRELELRSANLNKTMIEQLGTILTYGTQAEQISKTKAFLASGFWAEAYEGAGPELTAALDAWQLGLRQHLTDMESDSGIGATKTVDAYAGGLKGGAPDVKTAAEKLVGAGHPAMQSEADKALHYGEDVAINYADGMRNKASQVKSAADLLASYVRNRLRQDSPAKEGPLSEGGGTEGYGAAAVELMAKGMLSRGGLLEQAADVIAGNLQRGLAAAFDVSSGSRLGGISLDRAVLEPAGGVYASRTLDQMTQAGGTGPRGGGNTYVRENHVTVTGLVRARDPFEISTALERFDETGVFKWPEEPK